MYADIARHTYIKSWVLNFCLKNQVVEICYVVYIAQCKYTVCMGMKLDILVNKEPDDNIVRFCGKIQVKQLRFVYSIYRFM